MVSRSAAVGLCGAMAVLLALSCGEDTQRPSPPSQRDAGAGGDTALEQAGEGGESRGLSTGPGGNSFQGGVPAGSGTTGGADRTAAGGADATAAGGAGAAGADNQPTWLGLHCQQDADCGDRGLNCLRDNQDYAEESGAPPRGLCTVGCERDSDCRAFDADAVCGSLDEYPLMLGTVEEPATRVCLQGCRFGEPTGLDKCHGQLDMACRPFAPAEAVNCEAADSKCPGGTFCFRGFCREAACGPRCNVDADCSAGRVCNSGTGLCDEAAEPAPVGLDCPGDQDPDSEVCASGICLLLYSQGVTQLRMCTQSCSYGSLCGQDGACVYPRLEDSAAGDIAYCAQRCDCDADCRHPLQKCYAWFSPILQPHFHSRGVCDFATEGDETLDSCSSGTGGAGAGGAGAGGAEAVGADSGGSDR